MRPKQHLFLSLAALTLVMPVAQAEEVPEFSSPEVIVTATLTDRETKDVPAATQVITKEELEARGAETLEDALRLATGVHLIKSGTRQAISIRGFDSRFSLILIDGKRLAAEPDQNYELERISLENIERIEIVRGPASALYGTEAMGGVINLITKKSSQPSASVSASHGFYGSDSISNERYHFNYDSGKTGKFSVQLSGAYRDNDAMYKSTGLTYEPYGVRKNWNANVDYALSDTETLNFTSSYFKEKTQEITSSTVKAIDYNDRNEQSLSYSRKLQDGDLFFRYYQGILNKNLDQRNPVTNDLVSQGSWVKAKRTMRAYEGRLTRSYGDDHVLTYGAEYRPEKFRGTAVATGEGTFQVSHPDSSVSKTGSTAILNYTALYLQDEWTLSPQWLAVTSLRYDDSNKFESNLSPKLGLTYKLSDDTRLKFNAARGFRSPTPNQLYIKSPTLIGNANLKSEKSNSYDLSLERDFTSSSFKLTYFTNDVSNLIAEQATATQGINQYQNIQQASLNGLEASFSQTINSKLAWINSYTYLEAMDDITNKRLDNRARHVFSSRLSYTDKKDFTANLWAELHDDYLVAITNTVKKEKSYLLWNVAFSKKLTEKSKLTFGIDNLFDKNDEDVPLMGIYVHGGVQFQF